MDPSVAIQIVALVFLIFLSAFFSSAETAFVSVNVMRMRTLADEGNRRARRVLKIKSDNSRMLSAILIGNNLVNISASSLATTISLNLWGNAAVGIATGVLTFIVLIFGEISPKTLATAYADKISMAYCTAIAGLMFIFTPVIIVINVLAKGFLRLLGFNPDKHKASITEDELRTIVDVSHEEGVLENEEHEMISNVFDFGDSLAKDVMIPRIDMISISADSTYREVIEIFSEYKYTRFPVYDKSVDNVIGIINVKDMLLCEDRSSFSVKDILRKCYYTFEFKDVSELMNELKKTSNNLAIVVDEYGSTVGMITMEDLLEEIVGEIRDEYDEDEIDDIIRLNENEYQLSGQTRLDDLKDIFNIPEEYEESEDFDSISGLIIKKLERLPQESDTVELDHVTLVVEECDKNRIIRVHAYVKPEEDDINNDNTTENEE